MTADPNELATITAALAGSDAAWAQLLDTHAGFIRYASRVVYSPDPDGMYGTALEAFYRAVTTYDPTSGVKLGAHARHAMIVAVREAAGSDRVIAINNDALPRYMTVMRHADGDINAAYAIASAGGFGISPTSLLTIHRILRADGDIALDNATGPLGAQPREEVPAGFADDVLSCLDPFDRDVMRLRCGFRDRRLDELRHRAGFHEDAALSAREVGIALGCSRRTIDRATDRATTTMRAYLQDAVDAGLRY